MLAQAVFCAGKAPANPSSPSRLAR